MQKNCVAEAVIREGKALLYIPNPDKAVAPHGLEPAWLDVFYNPRMEFNRDMSVAALSVYVRDLAPIPDFYIVEPLTATGVRAVRYALEIGDRFKVIAGDIDACATSISMKNVNLNKLNDRVLVFKSDARELIIRTCEILERPPLVIDIDPFGSPAPYLDAALSVIGNKGLLAVTATDLAVLEGSKKRAALRRYWVNVTKVPESKEIGLRILIGYIARVAASHDKSIIPVLSYYADHYFRVYVLIERGARKADRMIEESLGYAYYCPGDKRTYLTTSSPSCISYTRPITLGPLWVSKLNDANFIERVIAEVEEREYLSYRTRALKLLELLNYESILEDRNLHVSIEQVASFAKTSMPPIARLIRILENKGYYVSRSHYSPTALRTNATYVELVRLLRAA